MIHVGCNRHYHHSLCVYHAGIVGRAVKSAEAQTIRCDVIAIQSPNTPAIGRNHALTVGTSFVAWLDADDILDPTFIAECVRAYQEGKYVYTSWYEGDYVHRPRECAWSNDSHHIVTTLYPTALFKHLGGFDERLPGHEDADFYMRSYAAGICGLHLDKPLVTRPENSGQRSEAFHARADYETIMRDVTIRNGGMARIMACCGQPDIAVQAEPGAGQPGDVLAITLWSGMRTEYSPYTERKYVGGNGVKLMVSPTDIENFPHLFQVAIDPRTLAPKREQVLRQSGLV